MACTPAWSKGGCVPVIVFDDEGSCAGPSGGAKTVGPPQFELEVTNPPDFIWRDEDFVVVQADDDDSPFEFDNV